MIQVKTEEEKNGCRYTL